MLNSTRSKPEPYTMLLKISFQADSESLRSYHHGVSVTELILLHLADKAITTALSQAHTGLCTCTSLTILSEQTHQPEITCS